MGTDKDRSSKTAKAGSPTKDAKEHIMPPDPMMLAFRQTGTPSIKVSPDGKSISMGSLNEKWVWTFTPTAK